MLKNVECWWRQNDSMAAVKTWIVPLLCGFHLLVGAVQAPAGELLDPTFNIGSGAEGGFVESMLIQPDGKILICGNFTSFNGHPQGYIARLNPDGSVDTSFSAEVGYWVRSMARQGDGKIVIGGFFSNVGEMFCNGIARLNADGSLDPTFDPGTGCEGRVVDADPTEPFVFSVALQSDGKVIVGGNFATVNGSPRKGLARLNADGSLDTTFNVGSGMNSWVRSVQVETNGQILAAGWFTTYNDRPSNRMVLINSDGSPDESFNPYFGESCAVYTMARQTDNKLVVVGHTISSDFEDKIARLNPDGSYDWTFDPGIGTNEKVEGVAIQPDGKIIIGGYFTDYNDNGVENIARIHPTGALDSSFNVSVNDWIWTVLLQNDGRILICGGFSTVNGHPRSGIARLLPEPRPMPFGAAVTGNAFSVSVSTQNGKQYSLQYKDSVSASWVSLPAVWGDGSVKTLTDSTLSSSTRFYRIMME